MQFQPLEIPDVVLVSPKRFRDGRGWFAEAYNAARFAEGGIKNAFVQDNQSFSEQAGTIRGLHFQKPPFAQAKIVRVLRGSIYDVAVDLRKKSPAYGKYVAAKLTAEGGEQLFIPAGFAHGLCTIEPETEVFYKVDARYAPETEAGIVWNDPDLSISWPVAEADARLSEKDLKLMRFRDFQTPF